MFLMAIKHKVHNYESWKSVYDTFPPTAAGALFSRVNRSVDDANDVLVVSDVPVPGSMSTRASRGSIRSCSAWTM